MKKRIIAVLLIVLIVLYPATLYAHSGRTDSSGGHRDNQNKSGLGYYHYHCGGNPPHLHNGGSCPYSSNSYDYDYDYDDYDDSSDDYPSSIKITNSVDQMDAGEELQLDVDISPSSAIYDDITWKSSDTSIASISSAGKVSAHKAGIVTISAETENGIVKSFELEIEEIKAEAIKIKGQIERISVRDTVQLSVEFTPENTTNKEVSWSSDDESIIEISEEGVLKGVGPGETSVYVEQNDLMDSFKIKVFPAIERVDIEEGSDIIRLRKGASKRLNVKIYPEDVIDFSVELNSKNNTIVSIENDIIIGEELGKTEVTATAINGVEDTIYVEVYTYTPYYIAGGIGLAGVGAGTILYRKRRMKTKKAN